ncbi:putative quinol monooxygenase [Streptomyces mexicanus]|uniref:Antibiotic biosynthesis monooxygenase n=1 Tax=Streptomyces mexicanus TaxID=178566 RepID=A0A7X1LPY6_9ACTN|nr:putative quinol monooxygenase [Streptomyces mexicanus]MBC2864967.1 antibiotic biosynthesis monooxygenase [Streptomyces mexicanus]
MIIVHGTTHVAPESRDAFLEEAKGTIALSLAEAGCMAYTCSEDITRPGTFHWIEEWADLETFNAHADAAHHLDFIRALADSTRIIRSAPPSGTYFDAEPLDAQRRAAMGFSISSAPGHIPS